MRLERSVGGTAGAVDAFSARSAWKIRDTTLMFDLLSLRVLSIDRYPLPQHSTNQNARIENDGLSAHAALAFSFFAGVLTAVRAALKSATTDSTSTPCASSSLSKVLLTFFKAAMSASTCPCVGMK